MVKAYWNIGKIIVEHEQQGEERAGYGKALITGLSKKLTSDYGKGFNTTNLWYMSEDTNLNIGIFSVFTS